MISWQMHIGGLRLKSLSGGAAVKGEVISIHTNAI